MTNFQIVFSKNALNDIEDSINYYNQHQENLGKKFALSVQATLDLIRDNPFYARVRYADIRCAVVGVFPYLIHYKIDIDTNIVKILSVYNTYRQPIW